jgi:hypothetical protein
MAVAPKVVEVLALSAAGVALPAWLYAARYFFPMAAAGFRRRDDHKGYMRKALIGASVFVIAVSVALGVAALGEYLVLV